MIKPNVYTNEDKDIRICPECGKRSRAGGHAFHERLSRYSVPAFMLELLRSRYVGRV